MDFCILLWGNRQEKNGRKYMIREKRGKRLIAVALIVALAGGMSQSIGASAIQDAKDKINEANQQLDQTKSQISDIEKKQNSLQ